MKEECEVRYRLVFETRAKRARGYFARFLFCDRIVQEKVLSGFQLHSRVPLSEASFLVFFIKSARKLVVEPPMVVGLSLISALVIDTDTCRCR